MKNIVSLLYEIKLSNGNLIRCHQNHLRIRFSRHDMSVESDSLRDKLLSTRSVVTTIAQALPSSP